MSPGLSYRLILVGLFALAAIVRVHGAWVAPPLSGFDGPYHAANVGIVLFEGRLPLPHEGWSTFHPPLYYALCAGVWRLLPDDASPRVVLFCLRLVGVLSGLGIGLVVLAIARLLAPRRPNVAIGATAVALFVPMHIGASFLVGNEILAAFLSAAGVLLLLRWQGDPSATRRAGALGAVLGLAALTKFSALVPVAVAGVMLLARGRATASGLRALLPAAVAGTAFVLVAGWYFARNLSLYGEPVVMQNEIVTREMRKQGYGPSRSLGAYLSLRPHALLDPADRSRATTAAVWPVTFASIWFDYHAVTLDVRRPEARGAALALYAFGAGWTFLAALAVAVSLRRGDLFAVPMADRALLLLAALTLASYVGFTWRVATVSALKGSYLSPGLPAFALLAGAGFDRAIAAGRRAAAASWTALAGFALAVTATFWVGWAPLPIDPASAYLLVYRDAAAERVYEFFAAGGP